jgi:cysteine-rich repeat protein
VTNHHNTGRFTFTTAAAISIGLLSACSLIQPELGNCEETRDCVEEFGYGWSCTDDGFCLEPDEEVLAGQIAADSCIDLDVPTLTSEQRFIPVNTEFMVDDFSEFGGCISAPTVGNDAFYKIDLVEGEKWAFHVKNNTDEANPAIVVLPGCDSRTCNAGTAADVCDAGGDEKLSVIVPRSGTYYVGVDSREPGGGDFELMAFRPNCGNGTVEPGEACDDGNRVGEDGCDNYCRAEIRATDSNNQGGLLANEIEPNDAGADANIIKFDEVAGTREREITVQGRIGVWCDRDTYAIQVPDGMSVEASVLPNSADACSPDQPKVRLVLCNPDGNTVRASGEAPEEGMCPELNGSIAGTTSLPGNTYFIRIRTSETHDRMDYNMTIRLVETAPQE